MRPSTRWLVAVLGLAAIVVLFVALRPGASSDANGSGSPAATASTGPTGAGVTPTGEPSAAGEPSPGAGVAEIDVTVRNGTVQGPGELEVTRGQRVRIVVDADVTDEVHVHGYDLHGDVAPGSPAEIVFAADAPGVFEVELEDAGRLLFELRVSP
ncbi:MAG: hypothetical protein ACE14W_06780 [Candidatus Velamenicoccus archaeovorus]